MDNSKLEFTLIIFLRICFVATAGESTTTATTFALTG